MGKKKAFFIKTFGCQMNEADSERIQTIFADKGVEEAKNIKEADLIIINSCIVRQSAENRVYGLLNNLGKLKGKKEIILTGCLAGWALKDKSGKNLRALRKRIGPQIKVILSEELADFSVVPLRLKKKTAFVPISNGCNNFCSYCIVPFARGKEISRPLKEIVNEVKSLAKQGYEEFVLLGQNVNSYGADLVKNKKIKEKKKITLVKSMGKTRIPTLFPHLLETTAQIPGVKLVDFISANPWDFSDDLIKVIAKYRNITRTIHLPVQSGDDQILEKMNRWYTAKEYLQLISKVKKAIPEVKFTTDIIVGFPGETKKQFENTVKLCRQADFLRAFIARYSPRPGTAAAKLKDNVSPLEKKRRWQALEKLINKKLN